MSHHVNNTAAAFMVAGGIMGARRGSLASLAAGFGFGALYAGSSYLISHGNPTRGFQLGTAASTPLFIIMSLRLLRTKRFMPAGAVASISLLAGAYNFMKYKEFTAVPEPNDDDDDDKDE
eukprot:426299_1